MAEYPSLLPRGEHEEFESSRDLPQKNRRAFNKDAQNTDENFTQVETKHGSTWTESEQEVRKPRVKQDIPIVVDAGPSVQVETKVPPTEADIGAELIKTMFTVAKRGTDATIVEVKPPQTLEISVDGAEPKVFWSNRKNIRGAEVVPEPQFIPEQMARIDHIKTRVHELDGAEGVRELTTDEFAERANLELELEDIYGPFQEQQEPIKKPEGTPKEWREKLRGLIEGASERFAKSKDYLNQRAKQIDAQAEGSRGERIIRKFGEQYNKLSFIKKLGIGVTLGVGTAVGTAFSLPLALVGVGGLVIQRAAGAASMFLKIEKSLQDKKTGEKSYQIMARKERAMLDAALYTFAFSYALKEVIEAAQEHGTVERAREWLGSMMGEFTGNRTEAGAIATAPSIFPQSAPAIEAKPPVPVTEAVAPSAPEVSTTPSPTAEVPEPAAAAAAGEQVSRPVAQGISRPETPTRFEMPKHADFSIHEDDTEISPYDVTPTDQTQAEDVLSVEAEEIEEVQQPVESQTEAIDEPLTNVKVPEPEKLATVDLTKEQTSVETPAEVPSEAPIPAPEVITNSFGLQIPTGEPHIYAGADTGHTFVFGGTPTERANSILQYLKENPNKVVFGPDNTNAYRVPWHLVEGKIVSGVHMRTSGFLGFFFTWMKPPGPEDLRQIIK